MFGDTRARRLVPLALALALTAACSEGGPLAPTDDLDALRSEASAARSAPPRPLKQSSRGTMAAVGPCIGGVEFAATGSGRATHVGRFAIELQWCMDPVGGEILGGDATIVSASGASVDMTLGGRATSTTSLRMAATIVGGSGRFENASGWLAVDVTLGPGGSWESAGRGEISY